jgi:hypothetical protein
VVDAGANAGDLMVVCVAGCSDYAAGVSKTTPNFVDPGGWSKATFRRQELTFDPVGPGTETVFGMAAAIYFRSMSGTETGDVFFLTNVSGAKYRARAFRWSGGLAPFGAVSTNQAGGANNPAAQMLAAEAAGAPCVLIGFGCVSSGSLGGAGNVTLTFNGDQTYTTSSGTGVANLATAVGRKHFNSAPADRIVDMPDEGALNILLSCVIR